MKTLTIASLLVLMACTKPEKPTLTVDVRGPGTVLSTPEGISCPPTCSAQFERGTAIALTAKGPEGANARFEVGELPPSTGAHRALVIDDDLLLTVTITPGVPLDPPPSVPSPYPTPGRGDPGYGRTDPNYIDGGPMQPVPAEDPPETR